MEVYFTALQKQIYDLWVGTSLTQEQIAVQLYGDKKHQGRISKSLKLISRKIGTDIVSKYPLRGRKQTLIKCNVELEND
jgi:hypothetical protein